MARLPQPGGDPGTWGNLLNEYLTVAHKGDGTLKDGIITGSAITNGSITAAKLAATPAPTAGQVLSYNGTALAWVTAAGGGSVGNATTTATGLVQLAGDLSGTATAPTVAANAITSGKIADGAVVSAKIATDAVTSVKIATDAVTSAKIIDGAVGTAKIANGAVTAGKLAPNAVTSVGASNSPVNGQFLTYNGSGFTWVNAPGGGGGGDPVMGGVLSGNASAAQYVAESVNTAAIGPNAVTAAKINDGAVGTAKVADSAITDVKLASNAVTAAKIADNTITEPKLNISNTPANNQVLSWNGSALAWATPAAGGGGDPTLGGALSGTASNAAIAANAVDTAQIAANAVTDVKINAGAVTTTKIADTTVTEAKLANNAVATGKIADSAVTGAKIADNTITEPKLSVSNTPASNQVLTWNGSAMAWTTPAAGGGGAGRTAAIVSTGDTTHNAVAGEYVIVTSVAAGMVTINLPTAPAAGTIVSISRRAPTGNGILVMATGGAQIEREISGNLVPEVSVNVGVNFETHDYLYNGTNLWLRVG